MNEKQLIFSKIQHIAYNIFNLFGSHTLITNDNPMGNG